MRHCRKEETKKEGDSVVINYEISEAAFKSQSFVGRIVAKAGATLYEGSFNSVRSRQGGVQRGPKKGFRRR